MDEMTVALRAVGVDVKGKRNYLVKLCQNNKFPLKRTEAIVHEGWYGKPKGAIQILWERGQVS